MPRFNYHNLAKRADKIMKQFGAKPSHAFFDRNGSRRAVTALEADFAPREVDGQVIQRGDLRFLVSTVGETTAPDMEQDTFIWIDPDTLVEQEYLIASPPKRTAPGGENVFWQLHCRTK